MTGTGTLGINTTTNMPITTGTGMLTAGGDLTVSGNKLYMGTNTAGYLMIADGTKFNPTALSGDATLSGGGALTIAASAITSGKILDGTIANGDIS